MREFQPASRPSAPPTSNATSTPLQKVVSQEEVDPAQTNGASKKNSRDPSPSTPASRRTQLRVDGFLGEWLSPSYFEHSEAPPSSDELIKDVKIVFDAPAEEIKGVDLSTPAIQEFVRVDWDSKEAEITAKPIHEKTGLRAMAAAGHAISKRPRRSFTNEKTNGAPVRSASWQLTTYNPPIPTYSIAPRDQIPIGFVAHARDACVDYESKWDSTKEPLNWGDGGPFGEEWSSMHRRFRNGLQSMLDYYETASEDKEACEDEDLVLVLVTHQAGANALIRLLTGAPALHDIGTASLSMAIRRQQPVERRNSDRKSSQARRTSVDIGIADDFEMKIIASTEHLRGSSNPLGLNSPRLGRSPALASRKVVGADSPDGFSIGDAMTRSNSSHGIGRSTSRRSNTADEGMAAQAGLWRRDSTSTNSSAVEENAIPIPSSEQLWGSSSESHLGASLPVRSASQRGMWGGESSIRRDRSPGKRRWTAVDRSP